MKAPISTFLIFAIAIFLRAAAHAQAPATEPKLPGEAQRLKTTFQHAVEQATQPLRERYIADLTRLLDQTTRAGQLNDAIAIKNELATVKGVSSPSQTIKNSRWDWSNSADPNLDRNWIELYEDGSAKCGWNAALKWKLIGKTLTLQQSDGRTWRFEMDPALKEGKTNPKVQGQEPRAIRLMQMLQ